MFWVYVIRSEKGKIYVGSTSDITSRIEHHNNGDSYWTSRYKNWKLVYSEEFSTRGDAMKREKELKTGKGRDELKRKGV
jgi:putative endonuclease